MKLSTEKLIKLITPEIKSYLHDAYQETIAQTIQDGRLNPKEEKYLPSDVLSIAKHHYDLLCNRPTTLTGKDLEILNLYIAGLPNTINQRSQSKAMTDFIDDFTTFLMYIGLWINHVYAPEYELSVFVESRRKDLTGELIKLLISSVEQAYNNSDHSVLSLQAPEIRDLFGSRIIIDNNNDPKILLKVVKIIVSILTNPLSVEHQKFYNWVKTATISYGGSPIPRERLLPFCEYTLKMSHEKNYVLNPKDNGYKTWQATFSISNTSPKACGSMFELQARTSEMHEKAEYGYIDSDGNDQRHDLYKRELHLLKKEIFSIDDYPRGGILYYNPTIGYDKDGVDKAKLIAQRTSSIHVVPVTSTP